MRFQGSPQGQRRSAILAAVFFLLGLTILAAGALGRNKGQVPAAAPIARTPAPYDEAAHLARLSQACYPPSASCLKRELGEMTEEAGPRASLAVFETILTQGSLAGQIDDHQIAHAMGRKTARSFGVNGPAFLLCPTTFNYGCQHGFFEEALGGAVSTQETANKICGSLDETFAAKFKSYCYHGLGHGLMMAQAYRLPETLAVCDSLDGTTAQASCWQGVFMENVNAALRGEARDGVFSAATPLAPCQAMAEKYQHECYINHAAWLMAVFTNDLGRAALACHVARGEVQSACLQSIGLMVTNPVWQSQILTQSNDRSTEEVAWELCRRFPETDRAECVIGGVDNLLNFDQLNIARAETFCRLVGREDQERCYRQIGQGLRPQTTEAAVVAARCQELPGQFQDVCREGAGL